MYKKSIVSYLTAIALSCLLFVSFVSAQGAAKSPSDSEVIAKVTEYMDAAVKVDGFSGSVLVAKNGKPLVTKGYGMASIEFGIPNAPQTIFRLGSVTKQFTGMAIAMLQERGKLSVTDPLCKYVENCPDAWKPITVKNLLTHTSGVSNYTSFADFAKTTVSPITNAEMIDLLRTKPLDFPVGEKFSYSNSGYFLLGEIIEKASGQTYEKFLQDNVFTPLGMSNTGYDSSIRIIKNRAAGYQRQSGEVVNASYMDMTVPYAAGSLYSTTGDLLIWDQALYSEKLVSKKSLTEQFTPLKGDTGYGYGWSIGKKFNRKSISHGGGIYGFATDISRFPDDKVTVVVLTNIQGSPAGRVSSDLAAIVFGEKYEIAKVRKAIKVDSKILGKYVGEYKIDQPGITILVTFEEGNLMAQLAGQSKFQLLAESETLFFSKDVNATFTFAKDANGQITGLTLGQGGAGYQAKKVK